jgi:hypothetical protein
MRSLLLPTSEKNKQIQGKWWFPGNEDRAVAGTLQFSQLDGGVLETFGALAVETMENPPGVARRNFNIIRGRSITDRNLTLWDCHDAGFEGGLLERICRYRANWIFDGDSFDDYAAINFLEISIRYSHLSEWVNYCWTDQRDQSDKLVLTVTKPGASEAVLDDGRRIRIEPQRFGPANEYPNQSVSISMLPYFRVSFPQPAALEEIVRTIGDLQQFLGFAVGQHVHTEEILGYHETTDERREQKRPCNPTDIYHKLGLYSDDTTPISIVHIPFTLPQIESRFDDVIRRWFALSKEIRPVMDLYFDFLARPQAHWNQRFLGLIGALEAYQAHKMDEFRIPKEETKRRATEVLDELPEQFELRKWAKNKLNFPERYSLEERMRRFFADHVALLNEKFENQADWIRRVVEARNLIAHGEPLSDNESADFHKIISMTFVLRGLLEMAFLRELGFSDAECDQIFERSALFSFMAAN